MKTHTIIGTAGHIDHGKTALIKALTGIDADRLKEEKERGITIDIGFAYWRNDVTIIDVPGHEKLIRNMVAGVSTIDFFILVIAADDGIMPQTIEHLDILNFFNIREGIVVINKIDIVDEEWLHLVHEEVEELLAKYNLSHLPIIDASAISGKNIDQIKDKIEQIIATQKIKHSTRPFRLNVDRSFSIKGFGTVITGTVLSGRIKKGDEVEIIPSGQKSKVRGIQAHVSSIDQAEMGFRAAINMQGIPKEDIERGCVIAEVNSMASVHEFIGQIQTISKLPIKVPNRSRIHAYIGTAERTGQIYWFENDKFLEGNKKYNVKIKLDTPIGAATKDAFLIRLHSPVITLAGGYILEINPPKLSNKEIAWQEYFEIMAGSDFSRIIETIIKKRFFDPASFTFLQQKLFEYYGEINRSIQTLIKKNKINQVNIKTEPTFIHEMHFSSLLEEIELFFRKFHKKNPLKSGLNRQELITSLKKEWIQKEVLEAAFDKLIETNKIKESHNFYALADFDIKMTRNKDATFSKVLHKFSSARFTPPNLDDLALEINIPLEELKSLLTVLAQQKKLILINRQFYLHHLIWKELLSFLRSYFMKQPEMPVAALKEFIQTTRKYAIPLFETLDSEGYTIRYGDVRKKGNRL